MSQPVAEVGAYKNMTATGDVTTGPCQLIGFFVSTTTSGTVVLKDGGSSGTVISGTITPATGFHSYPATVGTSLHFTEGGTIDVTFFFAAGN
jgi:hypothetical protein